jgi:uncharacterized protein (TIGR02246 family)
LNKLLVGLIASSVIASSALADPASSSTTSAADAKRQVLKLEREWTAAEIKRDAATLRRILDDRFVVTFGAGEAIDKEGFIKNVVGDDTDVILSQDLTDETVRVDRDTAVLVETDTVHGTNKGEPYTQVLRITTTYIKRHGRWLALAEQMVSRKPAADPPADEAAIRALGTSWFKAYNSGDTDGITALYAEEAVWNAPGAPAARGRAAIHEYFRKDMAASTAAGLTFKGDPVVDVGVSANLGWAEGTYTMTDKSGAAVDTGKYVTVYGKKDGTWQILRDIYNSNAPSISATPIK